MNQLINELIFYPCAFSIKNQIDVSKIGFYNVKMYLYSFFFICIYKYFIIQLINNGVGYKTDF